MSNSANGVGSGCPASRWLDAMTCWLTGCIACASVIHRTSLLDAWLHASRFNHEPVPLQDGERAADGKQRWADPWRGAGSG